MTIQRRTLVSGAGAALLAASPLRFASAQGAAEFSYKYGNNLPVTHPLNIRAQELARRASRRRPRAGSRSRSSRTTSSAATPTC